MTEQPSVGRVVHYRSFGTPGGEYTSQCRAATIAEVGAWVDEVVVPTPVDHLPVDVRLMRQRYHPDACALVVQNPTGLFFDTCRHDEPTDGSLPAPGGTWHWPERV